MDSQPPWRVEVLIDEAGRVPTGGPIRLALDRRLSPWSIDRSTVGLSSGTVGEFVFPWFDPIRLELVLELTRPLLVDTSYVITLVGLEDLDGGTLAGTKRILISSSATPSTVPPPEAPVALGEVSEFLTTACGGRTCHSSSDRAADLVLDSAAGIAETARGRPSRQVASVHDIEDARGVGLVDLPIIDDQGTSSSASLSYLTYKLLGDEHILGEAMPPPTAGPAPTADELARVARWIRTGAALE